MKILVSFWILQDLLILKFQGDNQSLSLSGLSYLVQDFLCRWASDNIEALIFIILLALCNTELAI